MDADDGAAKGPTKLGWRLQRDAVSDEMNAESPPSSAPVSSDPRIEVTFEQPSDDWPGSMRGDEAPARPPPLLPIPVPLPLVSPPPLARVSGRPPSPLAPRRAKAAFAIVAGLAATSYLLVAKAPVTPPPPARAPATIHPAHAAPTPVVEEPPAQAIVADPPAPSPSVASAASGSDNALHGSVASRPAPRAPAGPSTAPRRSRCRILNGEPCF